jgi:hypothetical protein
MRSYLKNKSGRVMQIYNPSCWEAKAEDYDWRPVYIEAQDPILKMKK